MSDSGESSYYEIALTNRQVLTVFVILLVCVVAAFLSGVWIGRQDDSGAVQVVSAQAINAGVTAAESPLNELHFFSEDRARVADAETRTGADSAFTEAPSSEAPAGGSPGSGDPPVARAPDTPAQLPSSLPAGAAEAPTAASSNLVVQVLSTGDRQRAETVLERLSGGGYPAQLSEVARGDQTMYRVRIGPYAERVEAQAVADRVRREFRLDTWITQ